MKWKVEPFVLDSITIDTYNLTVQKSLYRPVNLNMGTFVYSEGKKRISSSLLNQKKENARLVERRKETGTNGKSSVPDGYIPIHEEGRCEKEWN